MSRPTVCGPCLCPGAIDLYLCGHCHVLGAHLLRGRHDVDMDRGA